MITLQSSLVANLPCEIRNLKCFAAVQCDFLFLNGCGQKIMKYSPTKQTTQSIRLKRKYTSFCYDPQENCYWGISEDEPRLIRKLNACFKEVGHLVFRGPSQACALNLCVDACKCGIWLFYPNKSAFVNTRNGKTTWYKNEECAPSKKCIQGDIQVRCLCECSRQILKISAKNQCETLEILTPNGTSCIGIAPCSCDCSSVFCFCCLYYHPCSKRYSIMKYCVDFEDHTPPTPPCPCDKQHCGSYEIMHSIALEEAGISHILNAEGEKIQKAVAISNKIEDLLCVNESVKRTLTQVTLLEGMLYSKLEALISCSDFHPCKHHSCPCGSCKEPKDSCDSISDSFTT